MGLTVRVEPFVLPLRSPLVTGATTVTERAGVLFGVSDGEHSGWGEATPLPGWSTVTVDSTIATLRSLGPVIDPDQGATIRGTTVQLGLTRGEIDAVWKRKQNLVEAVDSGRMPVF